MDPYRSRERVTLGPRDPLEGRKPRVLAHVHRYHPGHNAGAESYLHNVLLDLVAKGWDVQVLHTEPIRPDRYTFEGVPVVHVPDDRQCGPFYQWADVVVTHLHSTRRAVAWCRQGRPLVHLVHNHRQLHNERVRPADAALVVWNAEWVAQAHTDVGRVYPNTMVLHPPIAEPPPMFDALSRFTVGDVIASNLAVVKGGPMIYELARRRPRPFTAIEGAYDLQWSMDHEPPPNLTIEPNGPPSVVAEVLQSARVALVPSHYESWGMFACEAIAAGIPVVAADTPGLREALTSPTHGPCALFVAGHDPEAWMAALDRLEDLDEWTRWVALGYQRAVELHALRSAQLDQLAGQLAHLAGVQ